MQENIEYYISLLEYLNSSRISISDSQFSNILSWSDYIDTISTCNKNIVHLLLSNINITSDIILVYIKFLTKNNKSALDLHDIITTRNYNLYMLDLCYTTFISSNLKDYTKLYNNNSLQDSINNINSDTEIAFSSRQDKFQSMYSIVVRRAIAKLILTALTEDSLFFNNNENLRCKKVFDKLRSYCGNSISCLHSISISLFFLYESNSNFSDNNLLRVLVTDFLLSFSFQIEHLLHHSEGIQLQQSKDTHCSFSISLLSLDCSIMNSLCDCSFTIFVAYVSFLLKSLYYIFTNKEVFSDHIVNNIKEDHIVNNIQFRFVTLLKYKQKLAQFSKVLLSSFYSKQFNNVIKVEKFRNFFALFNLT